MGLGNSGINSDRSTDQFYGDFMAINLIGYHSQQVHCLGMVRLHCKNLPISRFRLVQPASLVVLKARSQDLLNRQLRHLKQFLAWTGLSYPPPSQSGRPASAFNNGARCCS
jgi:hypothetical protein